MGDTAKLDDEAIVRRLELLLRVDERLTKLEDGKSSFSHRRLPPAILVALIGIVPPLTSAVYGAVSGYYSQQLRAETSKAELRLQEQQTKDARMLRYLEMAIDPEVPLENRQQLLSYMRIAGDESMVHWANEELERVEKGLGEATQARLQLEGRINELAAMRRSLEAEITRLRGNEPTQDRNDRIQRLREQLPPIDSELASLVRELDRLNEQVSDAPEPWIDERSKTSQGRWVVELATYHEPAKAQEARAKVAGKLGEGDVAAEIYQHGPNLVIAVGPYGTHKAASAAAPQLQKILGRNTLTQSLDPWCPQSTKDDDMTRCL